MSLLLQITLANFVVSLTSLIGALPLFLKNKHLSSYLFFSVSLSAGTLLGGAFLHLLPEAIGEIGSSALTFALISFLAFFALEKLLHWHHCHNPHCSQPSLHIVGYLNLIGDLLHNFLDGLIIAATFLASPSLGFMTTLAIIFHEIPQEIGDMGVLLHSGFSPAKALLFNLLTAFSALLGGLSGYLFVQPSHQFIPYLLSLAAGGFIYLASSDLLPELKHSFLAFPFVIFGTVIMSLLA